MVYGMDRSFDMHSIEGLESVKQGIIKPDTITVSGWWCGDG